MFLKKEKKNKRLYGGKRYRNLTEDEKQRLLEYRKNCFKMYGNTNSKDFNLRSYKTKIKEELMLIAKHLSKKWDRCISEDEKKK